MYNSVNMKISPTPNKIKTIAAIIFVFGFLSFAFAGESCTKPAGNKGQVATKAQKNAKQELNFTSVQKEARLYREEGVRMQQAGDLDAAMGLYQKAIVLDPTYAVPFNDLGIILEAKGFIDRAEENYLRCVTIDSTNLSAYTNLALLYENQRDINKAAVYWEKRANLGSPDDSWTIKASQRLNDIRLVLSDKPFEEAREQEVIGLMSDVSNTKAVMKKDNKALAKSYFSKAKLYFKKGDDVTALKIAIDAAQLDPSNKDIKEFVQKVQTRLLSK